MIRKDKKCSSIKPVMQVFALFLCLIVFVGAIAGCQSVKNNDQTDTDKPAESTERQENTTKPEEPTESVKPSDKYRALINPASVKPSDNYHDISEDFLKSMWQFASKTSSSALVTKGEKNALYSPISLYYALAMLEAGSANETKADLQKFLELSEGKVSGKDFKTLYSLMLHEGESEEKIANSVWIRQELGYSVGQAWLDQLANHFYASAFRADFSDKETAKRMSEWVAEQTKGKIKPEIKPEDADIVLMNTLYFKSEWEKAFKESLNEQKVFFSPTGDIKDVTFMNKSYSNHPCLVTDQFVASSINSKNGKIDFILPNEGITPESLLKDEGFVNSLRNHERKLATLEFSVPKFTYRDNIDILDAMKNLGLTDIVQGTPDFSVMLPTLPVAVSSITQETFIDLNEKGVEAAAFTMIQAPTSVMPEERETIVMNLNRPFIYVISDDAGVPLFVGIINNPVDGK